MNNLQLPEVTPSASAVVTRRSVKRRVDPIDALARPLGSKRLALIAKRTNAAASTSDRNAVRIAAGDTLLASHDGTVTFLLRATCYGLLMERTQRQASGMRLVQTMVFHDVKSFDLWCAVEPLRFDDGLLFNKLEREGHAAFAIHV
ncbi:MAG TPA: hypothetical protein DCY64_12400 [Hydrogenophaga sp.]|uniref:hypothetical protein n=1 Tax=Hydrogenophaga sp. TaxID=1904254 RepID=UPI0008C520F1|nr:hypothetical protein [Hydrogenophaga sp.]OGA79079.1 MAG: hypothetical protein A2X73_14145 [Burkholderiales bacterium GWE1_65_30]OGA91967.1 MAG: hypothetical protein A2X72_15640 [Burkholderiales bacterium GWF1_66_17]HAX21069.1 hypothetical protein [Hydrogenophaga sp.]HBU18977.1 hypothetical protein [Hydrogenophaga sp.]